MQHRESCLTGLMNRIRCYKKRVIKGEIVFENRFYIMCEQLTFSDRFNQAWPVWAKFPPESIKWVFCNINFYCIFFRNFWSKSCFKILSIQFTPFEPTGLAQQVAGEMKLFFNQFRAGRLHAAVKWMHDGLYSVNNQFYFKKYTLHLVRVNQKKSRLDTNVVFTKLWANYDCCVQKRMS